MLPELSNINIGFAIISMNGKLSVNPGAIIAPTKKSLYANEKSPKSGNISPCFETFWVDDGVRTHDPQNHNLML
jgi:hypothetical protein